MKVYRLTVFDLEGETVIEEHRATREGAESRIKEIEEEIDQEIPDDSYAIDEIEIKEG